VKLNPKKLYQADGNAVQELLKAATMLYKAYTATGDEQEEFHEFVLPTRLSNLKATKATAQEIIDTGAKLHDLLEKESELKQHRDKALTFLDNISRNLESNSEQAYIEKNVREIIKQQTENIEEMKNYVNELERDEKILEEKIKRQSAELDRAEKRLKSLTTVRPHYMDEYERQEQELERLYQQYLEKFRNLDYLEHQMDLYTQAEEEKFSANQESLRKMREKIKAEEWRMLRGEDEMGGNDEGQIEQLLAREEALGSRAQSRGKPQQGKFEERGRRGDNHKFGGDLNGPREEDEEEDLGEDGIEDDEGDQDDDEDQFEARREGGDSDNDDF
jgi:clusterin-associated protein 1